MHMRYGNCELANNDLQKIATSSRISVSFITKEASSCGIGAKVQEAIFDFDRAVRLDVTLFRCLPGEGTRLPKIG